MSKASQVSFNGGEYTEFMDPRVDVAKYGKGCRMMENFYPLPFGGAMSRPGTVHGGAAKYSDKKCRLKNFTYSTTTTFDIEVGHEYFRFWKDQAAVDAPSPAAWLTATAYVVDDYVIESSIVYRCIVDHTSGTFATDLAALDWEVLTVLEVTSPYDETDLFELQFEQVRDVLYIVHPDYKLRKLVRYGDDDWRLSLVDWGEDVNYPPLAPQNIDATKTIAIVETSGVGDASVIGGVLTLTASGHTWETSQIGDFIMVGHDRSVTSTYREVVTGGYTSAGFYVLGDYVLQTSGTGECDIEFQESSDNNTWKTKSTQTVLGTNKNVLITGSTSKPTWFRFIETNHATDNLVVIMETSTPFVPGLVKIISRTSPTVVVTEVIEPLYAATTTDQWAEQFFSDTRGHPRAVCIHRNRLCLASNDIWLSQPGNFEHFRVRNDADSGFKIAVNRSGSHLIQWMVDLRELRFGTTEGEAVIVPESDSEAFSYSNYRIRWDSNYGSKYLRAETINGTTLFLQPEGRTLRYQALTGIENFYSADTLTTLADHIAGDGITQTAYQRQRYPTFHGVRSDGQLASLLFEQSQNIQSWYRMVTDGSIESISVTPKPDEEDRVAYAVKRTVSGADVRHIEFQAVGQYRILQNSTQDDMFFVDDGVTTTGTDLTTISGLEHLEGVSVAILGDGAAMSERTVSGGAITLDYACDTVTVGRPYVMRLIPMYLESVGIMGRAKNISAAIVRLWRSGAARVKVLGGEWSRLSGPVEALDTAPPLQTGDSEPVNIGGDWDRNTTIEIEGRSPMPVNVQAITLEFEVGR